MLVRQPESAQLFLNNNAEIRLTVCLFHRSHNIGEWISGAVCMYVVNYLVESYAKDERVG